jgi:Holliday junction resolvase RusA-like endonuclease
MSEMTFFAPGKPAPKGSTRAFLNRYTGRIAVTADNRVTQKAWQSTVTLMAQTKFKVAPDGPVAVGLVFYLQKPKSTPKSVIHQIKKPDLDKLVRCVLDGLTSVVFKDDAQVTVITAMKKFCEGQEQEGCSVTVTYLEDK